MKTKERELLERSIELIDQYWDDSKVGYPRDADNRKLFYEIEELLAQPEPIKEREVSGKIVSTDDACNWNLTVAALKDYDRVYVNGIRYTEYQPDINTQYLLDQVSRLTAENAMLKEKWSAQPEQEPEPLLAETKIEWYGKGFRQGVNEFAPPKPLTEDVIYALDKEGVVENMDDHQVRYVIRWIRRVEKAHGIGGGE